MKKGLFYTGILIIGLELLFVALFALSTLDWSWLTLKTALWIGGGLFFTAINIMAIIFIVVGAVSENMGKF